MSDPIDWLPVVHADNDAIAELRSLLRLAETGRERFRMLLLEVIQIAEEQDGREETCERLADIKREATP